VPQINRSPSSTSAPIPKMTYQVLARKWRPQDFSSVIGQDNIVTALRNALSEKRIAQAYLFSGIRGVGKTSVARVLAKALNCEKGPASDPCNECQTCREITSGSDLDVIEVDAATYSKVEQIRELTESLKYGPARDRYKIVVIDEIHRLSRQAFDALLKIVEEPPPHLVFVFATTESDSVPATILSRCQEYHFRRVRPVALAQHLRELAVKESIEASDTALRLIARASEGSVRDAVALLDQLATYGSGEISDEDAASVLGGVDRSVHHRLLAAILGGDSGDVTAIVSEIEVHGWDPRHVFAEFLAYCRDALHLSLGVDAETVELPHDETERLAELAKGAGYENLLRLLHQMLGSESIVRRSDSGTLAVEIAWLRAAELPKLTKIETLLAAGSTSSQSTPSDSSGSAADPEGRRSSKPKKADAEPSAGSKPRPSPSETAKPVSSAPQAEQSKAEQSKASEEEAVALEAQSPEPAIARGNGSRPPEKTALNAPEDLLARLIEEVSRRRQSLAAHLGGVENLALEDGVVQIFEDPNDNNWLKNALGRGKNRQILEECLASVLGEGAQWKLLQAERPALAKPAPKETVSDPLLKHPQVQTALDIFGGTAQTAENDDS